jgi:hypothetical protein
MKFALILLWTTGPGGNVNPVNPPMIVGSLPTMAACGAAANGINFPTKNLPGGVAPPSGAIFMCVQSE